MIKTVIILFIITLLKCSAGQEFPLDTCSNLDLQNNKQCQFLITNDLFSGREAEDVMQLIFGYITKNVNHELTLEDNIKAYNEATSLHRQIVDAIYKKGLVNIAKLLYLNTRAGRILKLGINKYQKEKKTVPGNMLLIWAIGQKQDELILEAMQKASTPDALAKAKLNKGQVAAAKHFLAKVKEEVEASSKD